MPEIVDSIALDTGVLLEFLEETPLGINFYQQIFQDPRFTHFLISPLTVMELFYLVCRKKGEQKTHEILGGFLPLFEILPEDLLRSSAALLKCRFSMAIADCYSIAISQLSHIPIFMKREEEIVNAIKSRGLTAEIHFIDDLPR